MISDTFKILLIEDDEDDAAIVQALVLDIKEPKLEVDWVSTYEAGLTHLLKHEHDICLLDHNLGEHTGLQLLQEVFDNGCRIPVVMLTGTFDGTVKGKALKLGASDFLIKGQTDSALLQRTICHAIGYGQLEGVQLG